MRNSCRWEFHQLKAAWMHEMKLPEMPGPGHDEATPDRRLDLVERDADLQGVGLAEACMPPVTPAGGGVNSSRRGDD